MLVLCERFSSPFSQPVPPGTDHWKIASVEDFLNLNPPLDYVDDRRNVDCAGGVDLFLVMRNGNIERVWCFADEGLHALRAMPVGDLLALIEAYALMY